MLSKNIYKNKKNFTLFLEKEYLFILVIEVEPFFFNFKKLSSMFIILCIYKLKAYFLYIL